MIKFNQIEVIKGCKEGKSSAQKLLFEKFYGFVKKICLRYSADSAQTEEMINDSFFKVFKNINTYQSEYNFHAWLKTLVVRTCIDYYRKYSPKVALVDIQDQPFISYEASDALDDLSAEEILELVQKLPPSYRTVFSLYVIDGYSHAEIAEMLSINEGTSRSNLAKARGKLQEWIQAYTSDKTLRYYND